MIDKMLNHVIGVGSWLIVVILRAVAALPRSTKTNGAPYSCDVRFGLSPVAESALLVTLKSRA